MNSFSIYIGIVRKELPPFFLLADHSTALALALSLWLPTNDPSFISSLKSLGICRPADGSGRPVVGMELAPTGTIQFPETVEEIYKDYSGRRAAIVRALTIDVDEFYAMCDPEKVALCLYGHPGGMWEVTLPVEEVPTALPEPALGINFARDGLDRKDFLSLVAVHSDSWLLSVAFFFGAWFNGNERKWLFSMINELPTVFEVVTNRKPAKDKFSIDSGSKSRLSTKRSSDGQLKNNSKTVDEGYGEDDAEHSETLCGICRSNYNSNEFWIACDVCERWFHGKCVKVTPAKAENIKRYKCPSCSSKRGRQ